MGLLKWALMFVCAFAVAFVMIVTFSQPPFKQEAPAMIFTYHTPAVALYWYVLGALCLGLVIGLSVAAYSMIISKMALLKKSRQCKELEQKVSAFERAQPQDPIAPPPDTQLLTREL